MLKHFVESRLFMIGQILLSVVRVMIESHRLEIQSRLNPGSIDRNVLERLDRNAQWLLDFVKDAIISLNAYQRRILN